MSATIHYMVHEKLQKETKKQMGCLPLFFQGFNRPSLLSGSCFHGQKKLSAAQMYSASSRRSRNSSSTMTASPNDSYHQRKLNSGSPGTVADWDHTASSRRLSLGSWLTSVSRRKKEAPGTLSQRRTTFSLDIEDYDVRDSSFSYSSCRIVDGKITGKLESLLKLEDSPRMSVQQQLKTGTGPCQSPGCEIQEKRRSPTSGKTDRAETVEELPWSRVEGKKNFNTGSHVNALFSSCEGGAIACTSSFSLNLHEEEATYSVNSSQDLPETSKKRLPRVVARLMGLEEMAATDSTPTLHTATTLLLLPDVSLSSHEDEKETHSIMFQSPRSDVRAKPSCFELTSHQKLFMDSPNACSPRPKLAFCTQNCASELARQLQRELAASDTRSPKSFESQKWILDSLEDGKSSTRRRLKQLEKQANRRNLNHYVLEAMQHKIGQGSETMKTRKCKQNSCSSRSKSTHKNMKLHRRNIGEFSAPRICATKHIREANFRVSSPASISSMPPSSALNSNSQSPGSLRRKISGTNSHIPKKTTGSSKQSSPSSPNFSGSNRLDTGTASPRNIIRSCRADPSPQCKQFAKKRHQPRAVHGFQEDISLLSGIHRNSDSIARKRIQRKTEPEPPRAKVRFQRTGRTIRDGDNVIISEEAESNFKFSEIVQEQSSLISVLEVSELDNDDSFRSAVKEYLNEKQNLHYTKSSVTPTRTVVDCQRTREENNSEIQSGTPTKLLQSAQNIPEEKLENLGLVSDAESQIAEYLYVREIFWASGLPWTGFEYDQARINSSNFLLNEDLFHFLEQKKLTQVDLGYKGRQQMLDRRLVFDVVSNILRTQFQELCGESQGPGLVGRFMSSLFRETVSQQQQLLKKVWRELQSLKYFSSSSGDVFVYFNMMVEDTICRDKEWKSHPNEMFCVALEIEGMLFNDLIEETLALLQVKGSG